MFTLVKCTKLPFSVSGEFDNLPGNLLLFFFRQSREIAQGGDLHADRPGLRRAGGPCSADSCPVSGLPHLPAQSGHQHWPTHHQPSEAGGRALRWSAMGEQFLSPSGASFIGVHLAYTKWMRLPRWWQPQVLVWWASEQLLGWCVQLHLMQLAIFIFWGAFSGIIFTYGVYFQNFPTRKRICLVIKKKLFSANWSVLCKHKAHAMNMWYDAH